jgi:anti-sigma factor RsiW
MLDAYLDGELSLENAAAIQDHLRACARCSAQAAETARMQRALRRARGHFTPNIEFRKRVQRQILSTKRRAWVFPWVPAAVALVAAVFLLYLGVGRGRTADAMAEMADLHVNALASSNQVDVVSSDRHTVKPWFQGRIPFTFNLPEFSGTDFTLLGGRLVYFHQQPGAQLIVSLRQHKVSVLIFQENPSVGFSNSASFDARTSFAMETWHSQYLRFVLVSDADPSAIDELAHLFKAVNQ